MSSHIRCRTAAEIARDGDFITKGCGVDEMATFMLCQRSIHVTCSTPRDTLDGTLLLASLVASVDRVRRALAKSLHAR